MIKPEDVSFATDDVVVYLAAAGAGKTTAIIDEMTRLLKTYRPDEIAFVTFTRKGVANGIERALQANPYLTADDLVHFKTLHAMCFRELGLKHSSIIGREDVALINEVFGFDVQLRDYLTRPSEDDRLLARYDAIRSSASGSALIEKPYDAERYNHLIKAYEGLKANNNLVDFYDCLCRFRERNKPVNVKVAFIDEAQDLTLLQWEVCKIAFSACEKIRIAGDDFQSLFTYAGASPATLVSLADRYRAVKLETSYRLPVAVYKFAKGITRIIEAKEDKDFRPAKNFEGFVEHISDRDILAGRIREDLKRNGMTPYRWYLLFRNNCFIHEITALLERHVIPYHTSHDFCIPGKELAKLKRYYNYRKQGSQRNEAFETFCKDYEIKDINDDFTESCLIPSERRYVYFAYIQKYGIEELADMAHREPSVLLSTTHRVKGGEADFVVTFLDCTRKVAENRMVNRDEELRVLYVACTRAKLGLYLVAKRGEYGLDDIIDIVREQAA